MKVFLSSDHFVIGKDDVQPNTLYQLITTERRPDGFSLIRDIKTQKQVEVKTSMLYDPRYFTDGSQDVPKQPEEPAPEAEKPRVEIVLATAHKIDALDSLVVFVDPQYADFAQDIFEELRRVTGHENHTVLPVPADAVKIFKIQHQMTMSIDESFAAPLLPNEEKKNA